MSEDRKTLKRGLDALLGDEPISSQQAQSQEIAIDKISPSRYQARENINQESLEELTESISSQGVIQPIIVRRVGGDAYELIAGERRWRASKQAGLTTIPAIFKDASEDQIIRMGLIENLQREDLNPMEEARGLLRLQKEFNISQQDVASAVGKSRSGVANILRLNNLCKEAQNLLENSSIDMGHARALLTLPEGPQASFAKQAAKNGWSVRQTEKAAQDYLSGSGKAKTPKRKDANISALEEEISNELSSSVSIQHKKNGSGKIIFSYRDLDQLDKIIGPFRKKS